MNIQLLLGLCLVTLSVDAQNDQPPSLHIGDPAPSLTIGEWLKGRPVERFEPGNVYVLEFWATWCVPCKAAIPRLSVLAAKYKDKVTIIGVDVMELRTTSMERRRRFVDSMGKQMDYTVAAEDSNLMERNWFYASGAQKHGIPKSFVVDMKGRLAWIGEPSALENVLPKIISGGWDVNAAAAKRGLDGWLEDLNDSLSFEFQPLLVSYDENGKPDYSGKPDSLLAMIAGLLRKEPRLAYAPSVAWAKFVSLLKTNPHQAYEFGKRALVDSAYGQPPFAEIKNAVYFYSDKLQLSPEIYELGAEACQEDIDRFPYPEIYDLHKRYHLMAGFYRRAHNPSKAIVAEQKANEWLKRGTHVSANR